MLAVPTLLSGRRRLPSRGLDVALYLAAMALAAYPHWPTAILDLEIEEA